MTDRHEHDQERWLAGEDVPAYEAEVVRDPQLAEDAYAAAALDEALRRAAEQNSARTATWRRAWPVGLAAALVAWVLLAPTDRALVPDAGPRLRGARTGGTVTAVAPVGEQQAFPRRFVWHGSGLDNGVTYRWELYDAAAHRRAVALVADTVLVRPATAAPDDSVGSWRWLVVPLLTDGTEGATSGALEFRVHSPENE